MYSEGLEGVIAAQTGISYIDGENSQLYYRGYPIRELVEHASFEETAYLLWFGELPTRDQYAQFSDDLRGLLGLPKPMLATLFRLSRTFVPMHALRTAVSAFGLYDPNAYRGPTEANVQKAMYLMAHVPEIIAATYRLRLEDWPIQAKPTGRLAANFLWLLKGKEPNALAVKAMDACLVIHAEHGLNASSFVARVTASTLADMYSAVTAALGALSGRLHGAANQGVMEMLEEIGDPNAAEAHVKELLANRQRVMGFGHRIYKGVDPRAVILSRIAQDLCEQTGNAKYYDIAERVREVVHTETGLYPNVNFYTSLVLRGLDIHTILFPTIFAAARTVGWAAHVMEQHENNRLIRPTSAYIGPEKREYIPIMQRKE